MDYGPWRELATEDSEKANIWIKGIPFDGAASVGKGAANAPERMRQLSKVLPPITEDGILLEGLFVKDTGDFKSDLDWVRYFRTIKEGAKELLEGNKFCMFIGGDHSVTIPLIDAFCQVHASKKIGIIHFDAHADILDEYEGHRWSHACTVRRTYENNHLHNEGLTLIGIRSYEKEEILFLKQNPNIRVFSAREIYEKGLDYLLYHVVRRYEGFDAIYITLDIDVLDPAFAPGTGTPEGGGLSTREMLQAIRYLVEKLPVKAMDVVEISPLLDSSDITTWAGLKIIYEVFGKISTKHKFI